MLFHESLAIRFLENYVLSLADRIKSKKELCDSYQVNYSIATLSLDQLYFAKRYLFNNNKERPVRFESLKIKPTVAVAQ